MSDLRKKPCCICRRWFRPDLRVGARQRMCGKAEYRLLHRQKTQAQWRRRNRGYAIAYRIDQRAAQSEVPAETMDTRPLGPTTVGVRERRVRFPTRRFHWGYGALMGRIAKDEFRAYLVDPARLSGTLPPLSRKTSSDLAVSRAAGLSSRRGGRWRSIQPPPTRDLADVSGFC
jgi:hypothetical protein